MGVKRSRKITILLFVVLYVVLLSPAGFIAAAVFSQIYDRGSSWLAGPTGSKPDRKWTSQANPPPVPTTASPKPSHFDPALITAREPLPLGEPAPDFALQPVNGDHVVELSELAESKAVLLIFSSFT